MPTAEHNRDRYRPLKLAVQAAVVESATGKLKADKDANSKLVVAKVETATPIAEQQSIQSLDYSAQITQAVGFGQPTSCNESISSLYSTIKRPTLGTLNFTALAWQQGACPWEETRHSGYYSRFTDADSALQYAIGRICPQLSSLQHLYGHRFYFVGDSLMRQWTQSVLCRLRQSLAVVSDGMGWNVNVPNTYGRCYHFPGALPSLRHCRMRNGCVRFQHDVLVCYKEAFDCMPAEVRGKGFWHEFAEFVTTHGVGERTVLLLAQGSHKDCSAANWLYLKKFGSAHLANIRRNASVPAHKIVVVYKEQDATHFPTKSGLYNRSADRRKWMCEPVRPEDPLPPMRELERRVGLGAIKKLGGQVLETYADDLQNGTYLHATYARGPSKTRPVDCLHWMLPGVPDIWTEKLVRVLAAPVAPPASPPKSRATRRRAGRK